MINTDKEKQYEILAVVITGVMKFVMADWLQLKVFYIIAACLYWINHIYRKYRENPDILKFWGFHKEHFRRSFLFLLPFAIAAIIGILIYGTLINAGFLNWHVIPVFLMYPAWGIIQQFMIAALIAGNLKSISAVKLSDTRVILLTSVVFALVHYPSITLIIYAFVMEIIFLRVYFRWNNLWALGLYHGWVSGLFIFFVLERDLWTELWNVFS